MGRYKSWTRSTQITDLNKNDNNYCMPHSWIGAILIEISDPSWSSPTFVPPSYSIFALISVKWLLFGHLQEAKHIWKFQIFSSKISSGLLHCTRSGRLQEALNIVIKFLVFWQTGHWEEVVATRSSSVLVLTFVNICLRWRNLFIRCKMKSLECLSEQ